MRKKMWPVRTSLCLSRSANKKIKLISFRTGMSVSDVMRRAVDLYLANYFKLEAGD